MIVRRKFNVREVWVGARIDWEGLRLLVNPLPMCQLVIEPSLHGWARDIVYNWREGLWDLYVREFKEGMYGHVLMCRFARRVPTPLRTVRAGLHFVQAQETRRRLKLETVSF